MFGVPPDRAVALAGWIDPVMAESILALYRSAVDVGREWGPDFKDIPKPGLVLVPTEDPFLSADGAADVGAPSGGAVGEARRHRPLVDAPGPGPGSTGPRGVLVARLRTQRRPGEAPWPRPADGRVEGRSSWSGRTGPRG